MKIILVPEFEPGDCLMISDEVFLRTFFQALEASRKSTRPNAARDYVVSILNIARELDAKKK